MTNAANEERLRQEEFDKLWVARQKEKEKREQAQAEAEAAAGVGTGVGGGKRAETNSRLPRCVREGGW